MFGPSGKSQRFNGFAVTGVDEDFGRGGNTYDQFFGDPRNRPNSNLGAVATGPFYAMRLDIGDIGTKGGVKTDANGAVLRGDGEPIAGLYATGNELDNHIGGSMHANVLDGGIGADTMDGYGGDDSYIVDNALDLVLEGSPPWDGHDVVYSYVDHVLAANVEELSLAIGNAISGIGNGGDNVLYGNGQDNFLNGGYGADQLSGLGGNDTFVFQAGQAQGDTVFEFEGNGDAAGDVLYFTGYGTAADGATFMQQTATDWVITSADGLISETITLSGAPAVGTLDYLFV